MIPIVVLSVVLFGIGFVLNKNNAKHLLSGYNTMSEDEKSNFDLDAYLVFFRKFHLVLSISLLIVSTVLYFLVSSVWGEFFSVIYALVGYSFFSFYSAFNYKSQKKSSNLFNFGGPLLLLGFAIYLAIDYNKSLNDNEVIADGNKIEITGEYGISIDKKNIKSIQLVAQYPEIESKSNGFTMGYVKKGTFITDKNREVKLLINSQKTPLILIVSKDNREIYYSSKNKSNQEIYERILLFYPNIKNELL